MTALRGRFTRRGGGAIVHFDHPPIPDVIHFAGADWRAKREFHVTLAELERLGQPIEGAERNALLSVIQ